MKHNLTNEEVQAEYVSRMGQDLGRLCYELQDDLEWLRYKWDEFLELFGKGPERIELLTKVASNFFYYLQKLLYEDAMLHLCRLTDPPGNRWQGNLTLLRLATLIPEKEFSAQVRKDVEEVRMKCEFARKWRNKRLAHTDLMSLRNERASSLPSVTSQHIGDALESMRALMNSVEQHYGIPPSALARDPFAARSLVHYLEKAVCAEEIEMKRWRDPDGQAYQCGLPSEGPGLISPAAPKGRGPTEQVRAVRPCTKKQVLDHPSIADIPESYLVERLLADPVERSLILGLSGNPKDPLIRQKVLLAGVSGDPRGDVDVLLCGPGRPDLAVAIEVKRIKFGIRAIRSGKPNKLHELEKGVAQANRLARIGFSRVYLYVFVVVDTREQNSGRNTYSGLSTELKGLVNRLLPPSGLDERIGLYQIDVGQPMDSPPLLTGTMGGHLRRSAKAVMQPEELTEWVARAVGGKASK